MDAVVLIAGVEVTGTTLLVVAIVVNELLFREADLASESVTLFQDHSRRLELHRYNGQTCAKSGIQGYSHKQHSDHRKRPENFAWAFLSYR